MAGFDNLIDPALITDMEHPQDADKTLDEFLQLGIGELQSRTYGRISSMKTNSV